jgi:hypothetical protein
MWLIPLVDDCQSTYLTKLKRKTLTMSVKKGKLLAHEIELIIVYKLQLNFELYNVLKLQKYTIIVNSTMLVVKVSIWRALKILEFFFS